MDIPDEAWVAAHSVVDPDLDEVVRAAAPHIERAAQIEVLRELKAKMEAAGEWGGVRIVDAELEAGAGQTEVRDGE